MRAIRIAANVILLFFGTASASLVAQSQAPLHNSAPARLSDSLKAHGIGSSRPALVAALRNADSEVRSLAAMKLAEDHDTDAIAMIDQALSVEQVPRARIGMATSLSTLGDPRGAEQLQTACRDDSLPLGSRIEATQMLQLLGKQIDGCAEGLLDSFDNAGNDYKAVIVSIIPALYRETSGERASHIIDMLDRLIGDQNQEATVRMSAGNALAEIGLSRSVIIIRDALTREGDPVIRSSYERNVATIAAKTSQQHP